MRVTLRQIKDNAILTIHCKVVDLVSRLSTAQFADLVKPRLTVADVHQDQSYILSIRSERNSGSPALLFTGSVMTE